MKPFRLFTGNLVWLAPEHIISVAIDSATGRGAIIRMSNQDQWAVIDEPVNIVAKWETKK